MATVLEKVRRLEQYIETRAGYADRVLESTLDKILQREHDQLQSQMTRLWDQLAVFEDCYGLSTPEFYERFERGEMGDDADFFEWSATWEMVQDLQGDDERR
jgi:hypothetical protein